MNLGMRMRPRWAALPLELAGGVIFFYRGLQEAGEISQPIASFQHFVDIAGTGVELGGGILLLAGLFVRPVAVCQVFAVIAEVLQSRWNPVIGPAAPTALNLSGIELPLVLVGLALALIILGGDPLSIDDN